MCKKYIQKFDEVDSFFVQMRENQENNIELEENMIFVKGKESMLNILYKTIESIEYLFCKKNMIILYDPIYPLLLIFLIF